MGNQAVKEDPTAGALKGRHATETADQDKNQELQSKLRTVWQSLTSVCRPLFCDR